MGQDVALVGVAGAMTSGMLCAISMLKWRVFKLFKRMARERKEYEETMA